MMSKNKSFDYNRCVTKSFVDGLYTIECKLGLWGVSGSDKKQVSNEAIYYFSQYKDDGEYSSIIGGQSVKDKLLAK